MKCLHKHCTLCGKYDRDAETFVAWQCDECGMVTDREVSEGDLYRRDLQVIDRTAFEAAIRAMCDRGEPARTALQALQFLAGAVRR